MLLFLIANILTTLLCIFSLMDHGIKPCVIHYTTLPVTDTNTYSPRATLDLFLSEAPKGLRYDYNGKFTQESENLFLTNNEVDLRLEILCK